MFVCNRESAAMRSRREALKGLTLGVVFLGQTGVSQRANALSLDDECAFYAEKLAQSMSKRHGGEWSINLDHQAKFAVIVPLPGVD